MCTDVRLASLQELHANLQPLLHLFIDGASSIEQDDPNWELFLALQGVQGSAKVVSRSIKGRLSAGPGLATLRCGSPPPCPCQLRLLSHVLMHHLLSLAQRTALHLPHVRRGCCQLD